MNPDIVWIGISSPKQDCMMYHYHTFLQKGFVVGVGAVFDYISGKHKISPEWMKKLSLRWLYRLLQDPGRLWKKYLMYNFIFMYYLFLDVFGLLYKKDK
ncbi:MAG: WecB/TagA/CpsF family glycosyltransferase [Bacteroidales bacterium]|nr:WecB/TagA/CpsF family glycosyltransferase [Bacteroidales bacterium]